MPTVAGGRYRRETQAAQGVQRSRDDDVGIVAVSHRSSDPRDIRIA